MSTEAVVPVRPPTNPKPVAPPAPASSIPPPPAAAATKQHPPTVVKLPSQAVKLQIRDPNLHPYRPKSVQKKRLPAAAADSLPKRRCCSCCCFLMWFVVVALILSVAFAAACGVFWILYRPQRPKFTVASLKLANLSLTGNLDTDASGRLFTSGNLTVSAKNPNSKITAVYEETAMSVFSRSNVMIANSSFQPFASVPGNSTVMRFVFRNWRTLDLDSARGLRSDLTGRSEIGSRLELETKMGVRIGKWKTGKIGIRVTCFGLRVKVPKSETKKGSSATTPADAAISDDGKCKVDLSIKIWGFSF